jgi:hypothetical protein
MTVAPPRPLAHSYSNHDGIGENPYELIPSHWGTMERWRVTALQTGEMNDYERVRNDAIEAQTKLDDIAAREEALDERERGLGVAAAQIAALAGRASVLWDRIEQARADQREEPLAHPPGEPGETSKQPEPSLPLADDTHVPTGDLHDLPAKEDPDVEEDTRGEFLRLKAPMSLDDEVEFPTSELPQPPVVAQPIAAGLDQDDQS